MIRRNRLAAVLLAFLMLAAVLCGCNSADAPAGGESAGDTNTDVNTTDPTGNENTGNEGQNGAGTNGTNTDTDTQTGSTEPEVDTDPQLEGVYASDAGMIVIRYADEEMCDIIVSFGEDGADAYVSGIAQVVDGVVVYQTEGYAMTMTVNFDELTIKEEGANPYYSQGFAGTYTRSERDPYSIEARPTVGAAQSPDVTGYAIVNGAKAILYVDPESRFTATVPDIFSDRPEDKQPETGIYFGSIDNDVYALIEVTDDGGITAQQLKEDMETQYGVEADLFVNGMVTVEYTYTVDGEEWIGYVYACVLDDQLVRIEYSYIAAQHDYYSTHLDQISINIS